MDSKFDVIIFGATGCVGKYVVLEAVHVLEGLTWAIAGRSRCKLEHVLAATFQETGIEVSHIPIVIADANDPKAIEYIARKCKVLVNCCGPYQLWAELIINICLMEGTHYVDMCNDPYFNELMELRYHKRAAENNVYIVSACGFQSFPIEMGINYIKQHFKVWLNLIWSCTLAGELPWLRAELRENHLATVGPKKPRKDLFHKSIYSYNEKAVFLRFPFIDQQLVERMQYQFQEIQEDTSIGFYKYLEFPSFLWAIIFLIWFLVISFLVKFCVTRNFIILYPKLFSFGVCSLDGPPKRYASQFCSYKIILNAEGWSNSLEFKTVGRNTFPDRHMSLELSGHNPIYGCGCLCLLLSARCLLEAKHKLPTSGGVYSPGYAFHKIDVLEKFELYPYYLSLRTIP